MKGWVGLVGWPIADGLPTAAHHGHPSAAGRAQDRESSPARDRRSTAVPRHQLRAYFPLKLCPKLRTLKIIVSLYRSLKPDIDFVRQNGRSELQSVIMMNCAVVGQLKPCSQQMNWTGIRELQCAQCSRAASQLCDATHVTNASCNWVNLVQVSLIQFSSVAVRSSS